MLELNGKNLMGLPLAERKRRLEELLKGTRLLHLLFSANLSGTLQRIWQEIQRLRLEGVVAKRANSVYEPGMRSGQWVKVKAINQQEFVIGGYTAPAGSRIGFGALLVGVFDKGKLLYCGKVGTGFNRKLLSVPDRSNGTLEDAEIPLSRLAASLRNCVGSERTFGSGITTLPLGGTQTCLRGPVHRVDPRRSSAASFFSGIARRYCAQGSPSREGYLDAGSGSFSWFRQGRYSPPAPWSDRTGRNACRHPGFLRSPL